jgi:adenylosuccinate synthase
MVDVLLGLQWGDEGKGKIVDYLAPKYDMVARFQGGPNAGHTIIVGTKKIVLHTVPSGILHPNCNNLIGNGVVLDPITFLKEIAELKNAGVTIGDNLMISKKAHLILPTHKILDAASEASKGSEKIGSTLKGIGPTYMDKTGRTGLRIGDILSPKFNEKYQALKQKHLSIISTYDFQFDITEQEKEWMAAIETIKNFNIVDGEYYINDQINKGKKILAEGAQGSMLDIDFGTYPFVTSSNTITASTCTGLGISPKHIGEVIGITKAYCTRVGSGPFPSELLNDKGEQLRKQGNEFGSTTGRPRRCGWLDLVALNYAIMLNGVTQLVLTKADVMNNFDEIEVVTAYHFNGADSMQLPYDLIDENILAKTETLKGWNSDLALCKTKSELPNTFKTYLDFVTNYTKVPFSMISTGAERSQLIVE